MSGQLPGSGSINDVRFFEAIKDARIAWRMNLIRLLMVVAIASISGLSHAAAAQLISVKEVSSGVVSATVGLFTAEPPKPSDFWLRFDPKSAIQAREVKPAGPISSGTSVIFCIDQGASMGPVASQQIQEALGSLVSKPAPQLNVELWVFNSEVTKLRGFSRDGAELAAAIHEIGTRRRGDGKTKLYEAIALTLSELRNYRTEGLKRLILITAGKDDGSSITEDAVINEANAQNIEIDAIAFGAVADTGPELLARLARDTNGHFMFAANTPQLARELHKLLDLTPVQVVDVLFQYDTAEELHRVSSAQLEFAPARQTPVSLPIRRRLSAPWSTPFGGAGGPDHPASKQEVHRMIFQWITVGATGYIAYLAVYILSRKRAKPRDRSAPGNKTDDWRKP
jgi:von Willebrand factor type A domain